MKNLLLYCVMMLFAASCAVQNNFNPSKKYAAEKLREDFDVFRNVLEETHPSVYWYTAKDSMDFYFEAAQTKLKDSMTENSFRYVLSYVTSKIKCGHTSVMASKAAANYAERARSFALPLSIKAWPDTVIVTSNLNRRDSLVTRGVILKSIEGRPVQVMVDSFFSHLSTDGYNTTHKYQQLSNGGSFRNFYAGIYGLKNKMKVEFIDTAGVLRTAQLAVFNPGADTAAGRRRTNQPSRKERRTMALQSERNLRMDTALSTAFMEVNSFAKGKKLRSFFRQSFKKIYNSGVKNLVIDMRGNGGGNVTLSNLLTKYIADAPFKIADSLYAIKRGSRFSKYRSQYFLHQLFFLFFTRKRSDGNYHFNLYEGKYFKPKTKNNFNGTTYILTGGNTFSAAALFTNALKKQPDVIMVGEETGGGAYGNSAWLIPEVTLPNTGVRFRLPLFRLVVDKNAPKGRGILPEVEALPNVKDIRRNADFKMEKVVELIKEKEKA